MKNITNYKMKRQEAVINSMIAFEEMTDEKDKPEKRPILVLKLLNETTDGVVEEIVKEIEKKKIKTGTDPFIANFKPLKGHVFGYNQALQDLLSSLKQK